MLNRLRDTRLAATMANGAGSRCSIRRARYGASVSEYITRWPQLIETPLLTGVTAPKFATLISDC